MKRLLGIDYGKARIGLALSDELQLFAHPAETIVVAKQEPIRRIVSVVREKEVERVIVGLPRHMDGRTGVAAEEATGFAEKLRAAIDCPVELWDERLSTVAAQRVLRDAGKSTRESRSYIDQVAAQMLLQSYLDWAQLQRDGRGETLA